MEKEKLSQNLSQSGTQEETIGQAQSKVRANRILSEVAVAGNYVATGIKDGLVIYSKKQGKGTEEISVEQKGKRLFEVVKRIKQ